MLLLALNESFDRRSIDMLLALDSLKGIMLWGDGVLNCAALVASSMISVEVKHEEVDLGEDWYGSRGTARQVQKYWIELSVKGRLFVEAWKRGDQSAAVNAGTS
jgi:hypothetical protein